MPKRRKSNLTGNRNAKRFRRRRENETEMENNARLDANTQRNRVSRQNESEEATTSRRASDAARHAASLRNENLESATNRRAFRNARMRVSKQNPPTKNCALSILFDETTVQVHDCGLMNKICIECDAKHFADEEPQDGKFSHCCQKGKVQLAPLTPFPEYIQNLMTGSDYLSQNFQKNIRKYNSSLAFASMGGHIDPPPGFGTYSFRLHGQMYHRTSALHPPVPMAPKYAQLYVLDTSEATNARLQNPSNQGCLLEIMDKLDVLLRQINPYAHAYKMMYEVEEEEAQAAENENRGARSVEMTFKRSKDRRCDLPTANEVAIVFFSNGDGEPPQNRDFAVHPKAQNRNRLENISYLSRNCDPMTYPLIFPHGDVGWEMNTPHIGLNKRSANVTHLEHYQYRIAIREDEFNPIWNSGNLAQQFVVDAYLKYEANKLNWIKENQKQLRVDMYSGLMDHVNNRATVESLQAGNVFILPSSYMGSPRCMQQNYQDSMAIVRKYGKPDLFLTMTCNPKWPEIQTYLENNQTPENRPDLVARVFDIKHKSLRNDITVNQVLGGKTANMHVIEFQKRGLPHGHNLIILDNESKFRTKEQVDQVVCAELPDKEENPELYKIVTTVMIHGPCGRGFNEKAACLDKDGNCTKGFSHNKNGQIIPGKPFVDETNIDVEDGYIEYRRRNNGVTTEMSRGGKTYTVDNRWVVPYNPYLSMRYNCHINLEICASVQSVKYLYKYIYKGHDCANVEIVEKVQDTETLGWNEIRSFISSRYVSAPEATWRLFEKPMYKKSHTVIRLAVHLPNEHMIYFADGQEEQALARNKLSSLLAWFKLNSDPDDEGYAHQFTYPEIPCHYTADQKTNIWHRRMRGHDKIVSRMYTVSPSEDERYFLRLLLLHVKCCTSFEDIRTVTTEDGEQRVCATFRDACRERGLLDDDTIWDQSLEESALQDMPSKIRHLFAMLLVFCNLSDPRALWNKYENKFIEDYLHRDPNDRNGAVNRALWDLKEILQGHNKKLENFGLDEPSVLYEPDEEPIDEIEEWAIAAENIHLFNDCQRTAVETIKNAVEGKIPEKQFFLDGPAGSGKTFLYNTIISYFRSQNKVVLSSAFTGIAGNLLKGGTTCTSLFGIPLNVFENSVSKIKPNSKQGRVLANADLFIIDEVSMISVQQLRVIELLLRQVTGHDQPFGGKVVLCGGDFRQTLPVVKRGNQTRIVEACLKKSPLWRYFHTLRLDQNMRAEANAQEFASYILQIGNGASPIFPGTENAIEIPEQCLTNNLIDEIYGKEIKLEDLEDLEHKAIVTPLNKDCHILNETVLNRHVGEMKTYLSFDDKVSKDVEDDLDFPIEYLNSLTPNGFPPHKLNLKVGSPIMLLRNLNKNKGLCNGARLTVLKMHPNVIIAKVITGKAKGETVFIPRIIFMQTDEESHFSLRRRQFPVRLAYAMTINKSQGQSFKKIGIFLPNPVFSHGQLYVAFSRGKTFEGVKVQILDTDQQGKLQKRKKNIYTPNVVYREVLD